jgi:hypothetical protein
MSQKTVATEAAIFIGLALLIAAVLETVARISNLLNQPINPVLLAAGAISAAVLRASRRSV